MNKKIAVSVVAAILGVTTISGVAVYAKSRHTSKDLTNMQDFLLGKETDDLSGVDYDLNNDGRWDVFDLCLMRKEISNNHIIPQELKEVPSEYYSAAQQQGELVELYYDTWENLSYEEHTEQLNKRAIVYLPYGYDENEQYNVFYLMHGGWGNETTTMGTPDRPGMFKNVIDNAIQNGEIKPLIIVSPTYNNTSSEDSASFSLAMQLNRTYYHELLNDLIPAVEGKYSSYAASTSAEDLMASRDHRGFGGFSMGSVATWRTFEHGLDYFHYFLPMSCGTSLDDTNIISAAEGRSQDEYFVWMMTGTSDFAYSYDNLRADTLRNSAYFTETADEEGGNFVYRVKEGYSHDGRSSTEYTYNGLMWFWN